jgi:hypothetical protein
MLALSCVVFLLSLIITIFTGLSLALCCGSKAYLAPARVCTGKKIVFLFKKVIFFIAD